MERNEILDKVYTNKLKIKKAYKRLYKPVKIKRARFVKMQVIVPESKGVTRFLKVLFMFPIPTWLLKVSFRNSDKVVSDEVPILIKDVLKNGLYKNMFIKVNTNDGVKVIIKTI